jgi:hypothetical protein
MNTLFVITSPALPGVVIQLDAHVAALLGMTIGCSSHRPRKPRLVPRPSLAFSPYNRSSSS